MAGAMLNNMVHPALAAGLDCIFKDLYRDFHLQDQNRMFIQKMGYFIHVLVLKCMVRALGYGGKDASVPQGMYDSHAAGSRCASDIGGIHARMP